MPRKVLSGVLLSLISVSYGTAAAPAPVIQISHTASHSWMVDVKDMPAEQLLAALSEAAQTAIRFNQLPMIPVTQHCEAAALMPLVRCLLGDDVKLVQSPQGLWLLDGQQTVKSQPKTQVTPDVAEAFEQLHQQLADRQSLATLQPQHRSFYAVIDAAFASSDAALRAQAVAKLANSNSAAAEALLYRAVMDTVPSVRLQAVESAAQWPALLALASQDTDATVRDLAVLKLQQIK